MVFTSTEQFKNHTKNRAKKLKPIKNYVKKPAKRKENTKFKKKKKIVMWNNNLKQIHIIQE